MTTDIRHRLSALGWQTISAFIGARRWAGFWLTIACLHSVPVIAEQVSVAVAANFAEPLRQLAAEFNKDSGHQLQAAIASTGTFYAQIRAGAPFDILLAADEQTPARLEKEGLGVAGSRFTYANGKLLLWSRSTTLVDPRGAVLQRDNFRHLAVANPRLAPYGAAAFAVLKQLGLTESLRHKLVMGENAGQTYQFVVSGNAELGFIALSQVARAGHWHSGSGWLVPPALYPPIRQDAVLLVNGRGKAAAEAFLAYLRSEKAKTIIRSFGYDI